jgi:imidazolonepropionase-like amidohydrolase
MKIIVTLITSLSLFACSIHRPVSSVDVVLQNATIINPDDDSLQTGMSIHIVNGVIKTIGKTSLVKNPKKVRVIDAKHKYIIPGLWDAHVHLSIAGKSSLPLLLANGITSVRDLGSNLDTLKLWRKEILQGRIAGPMVKTSGPIIENARWLNNLQSLKLPGSLNLNTMSPRVGVSTPEDGVRVADSLVRLGVDMIKTRTNASAATFFSIARAAKTNNIKLVGHAPPQISLRQVADSGMRGIEHIETITLALGTATEEERKDIFRYLQAKQVYIGLTMIADLINRATPDTLVEKIANDDFGIIDYRRKYLSDQLASLWKWQITLPKNNDPDDLVNRMIKDAQLIYESGIKILAGTDIAVTQIYPGFSLHDELELLVTKVGLSPLDALKTATIHPAEFFGLQGNLGRIKEGMIADLVILNANPLLDIRNTRRIEGVIKNTKHYSRKELDQLLKNIESRN